MTRTAITLQERRSHLLADHRCHASPTSSVGRDRRTDGEAAWHAYTLRCVNRSNPAITPATRCSNHATATTRSGGSADTYKHLGLLASGGRREIQKRAECDRRAEQQHHTRTATDQPNLKSDRRRCFPAKEVCVSGWSRCMLQQKVPHSTQLRTQPGVLAVAHSNPTHAQLTIRAVAGSASRLHMRSDGHRQSGCWVPHA